ncbi:MAG: hypothetical protein BMS9Abin05_1489 [Rhodothermia bacterium]|nr:MAG: hypothetical protein BMS9Abin05_1489 [Rhodothermia bacterium]
MIDSSLSHYKIVSELGRGGMGIVYKATDTKLNRTVALKVLPAAALASEDDRARFFREAQAAAQLTHAHIATVYEIDEAVLRDADGNELNASDGPRPFIAMEYIEGETLETRIEKGPLKLAEAVRLAVETADALRTAHAKNIVHRDVKSANVMVTTEGKAKVLDFGLAKTTHSTMLTRMGSTLGTVAFMSPEQARGEEVDNRTDLYSLGTMLYEMVAGRRPFAGEYEQAVVYAILNEPPEPLTALRSGVPMGLEWIVNKCLAKNANDRYQTASDLMVDLRNLDLKASGVSSISSASMAPVHSSASALAPARASVQAKKSLVPLIGVATFTMILGLLAGFLVFRRAPEVQPLTRVTIDLPGMRRVRFPVMSPTREFLAFSGTDTVGQDGIFLRDMAAGDIRYIQGSEAVGNREIVFSPDGARLAFTSSINQGVFTVVIPAGLPERQTGTGRVSFWESAASFVFVDDVPGGATYRKTLGAGEPKQISLKQGDLEADYVNIWKTRIPGSGITFGHRLSRSANVQTATSWLIRTTMEDGKDVEIVESPIMNPEYVHGGFLAYQQRNDSGTLVVRPVDPATGEFLGPPKEVLTGETTAWGGFSVSANGDLLYIPSATAPFTSTDQLYLIDLEKREVNPLQLVIPAGSQINDVVFSPDGSRLVLTVDGGNDEYLAIYDLQDQSLTQITFGVNVFRPTWSWDGDWVYYSIRSDSASDVYRKRPVASSTPEPVISNAVAGGLSPNGRLLAFTSGQRGGDRNLMLLDLETKEITPVDTSGGDQVASEFSPDGQYIVYQNILNGFEFRVASVDGSRIFDLPDVQGVYPRWSGDGNSIYFSGRRSYRLPVRTLPAFNVLGDADQLFTPGGRVFGFDISPGEKTVAVITTGINFDSGGDSESSIVWLQNWSDHLKREFAK